MTFEITNFKSLLAKYGEKNIELLDAVLLFREIGNKIAITDSQKFQTL